MGNIQLLPQKTETMKERNKRIFGDKIRAYRILRGMSQPKLAAILGITKNAVTNWETGLSRPDFDTVALLCRTLDISADDFFGLPNRVDTLAVEEREHLRRFRMLSKYEHMSVDKLIDFGRVLGVVEESWRATPEEQAALDEIHLGKKRK